MVLLMFCLFYYFFSFYVSGMEKEDCQLGPMSCQKKENRMPLGGLTALCLYAKTLHNTLNHVTQKVWMDTHTTLFGNFLISSGTFKDLKSYKYSEIHCEEKRIMFYHNELWLYYIVKKSHPTAQAKTSLSLYHYACYNVWFVCSFI